MLTRRTFVVVAALIVAGVATPAFADPRDISVGCVWITRITHDWAGVSAVDRATEITRRITQVFSMPQFRQGAVVAVRQDVANALITVGNVLVFMVTPADAAGNGTPMHLAKYWVMLLGQGLTRALPGSAFCSCEQNCHRLGLAREERLVSTTEARYEQRDCT